MEWVALGFGLTALGLGLGWMFDKFDWDKRIEAKARAKYEKVISDLNKKIDKLQGQRK